MVERLMFDLLLLQELPDWLEEPVLGTKNLEVVFQDQVHLKIN